MPYIGLHPFLQDLTEPEYAPEDHVSMPYIGLHPFLRSPFKTNVFPVRSDPEFAYVFESG